MTGIQKVPEQLNFRAKPLARIISCAAIIVLAITTITVHFMGMSKAPKAIFCDEASFIYNAYLIGASLRDEWNIFLPVFFKEFGEYANPIFIYSAALSVKLLGPSVEALRVVNAVYALVAFLGLYSLVRATKLYFDASVLFFIILIFGFTPWLFPMSRAGFEVFSQVAFLYLWLFFAFQAFESDLKKGNTFYLPAIFSGVSAALITYSYSTGRLLGPLFTFILWCFYRKHRKKMEVYLAMYCAALIPFLYHVLLYPNTLTIRFARKSYWYDTTDLWHKIVLSVDNYLQYFSWDFLLARGYPALERDSTGFFGMLYAPTALLAVLGVFWTLRRGSRYGWFLVVLLLCSPLAAALTENNVTHPARSILCGALFVLFAIKAISYIAAKRNRLSGVLLIVFALSLLAQSGAYTWDYFKRYNHCATKLITGYDSDGFDQALRRALSIDGSRVLVMREAAMPSALIQYFTLKVPNSRAIRVRSAESYEIRSGDVVIYCEQGALNRVNPGLGYQQEPLKFGNYWIRRYL